MKISKLKHRNSLSLNYSLLILGSAVSSIGMIANEAEEEALQLEDFNVDAEFSSAETTRELSPFSRIGGSILDIPRTAVSIDRHRIEERGATSLQDTLGYTSGVQAGPFGFDSRLDSARVRGISPLKFQDGFQSHFGFYNNTRPDVYTLESVEVIKGPASVLYGRGALGGIVNAVSKLPVEGNLREIEVQYGSHDRKQVAADFSGRIDGDGTFLYRLVGVYRDSGTQVDYVKDDALVIMPSLTWKPSEDTSLTLLANFQENKGAQSLQFLPNEGALLPGKEVPTSRFIGEPGWDRYDTEQDSIAFFFDHKLSESISLSVNSRYMESEADYKAHWVTYGLPGPLIDDEGNITRTIYDAPADTEAFVADVGLKALLGGDKINHNVSVGVDYRDVTTTVSSFLGWAGGTINIHNPVYGNLATVGDLSPVSESPTDQLGIYLRDQVHINNWIVSLGVRHDSVSEGSNIDENATTGEFGAMYKFENGITPYISWAESFEPLGSVEDPILGKVDLDPKTGRQYEVGVKFQSKNGRSFITFSTFDVVEDQRPIANGAFITQTNSDIEGVEIEGQFNWKDLYVQAGYSYLDAVDGAGNRLATIPNTNLFSWITYEPSSERLKGLRTGLGFRYAGDRWDGTDTLKADDYLLVDLMVGYDLEKVRFQLNVNNLEDKTFVAATQGGRSFYGARRSVTLSAKYRF